MKTAPLPAILHGTVEALKPAPVAANRPSQTDSLRSKHLLAQLAADGSIGLNSSIPFGVTAHYLTAHTQRDAESTTLLQPVYDHFRAATRGSRYGHTIGREQFSRHVNRWAMMFGQHPLLWGDLTVAIHGMGIRDEPLDDTAVKAFIEGVSVQGR